MRALTLRRVGFTDRILHLIRKTEKSRWFVDSDGGGRLDDPYGSLNVVTLLE